MAPSIDEAAVQPLELRPKLDCIKYLEEVPLIDLSPLRSKNCDLSEAKEKLASQLHDCLKEWGFFLVVNHGMATDALAKVKSTFTKLPEEDKKKVARNEKNPWGYSEKDLTKNTKDWVEVFDYMVAEELTLPETFEPDCKTVVKFRNNWPENQPEFQKACEDFTTGTMKLLYELMELIALSLGLSEDRLKPYFDENLCYSRINYYPPCPTPELALGKGAHKDHCAYTVLATDEVSGFEVMRKSDGEWLRVRPIPDSVIVVGGDILQVWSNEIYESVVHRAVVNSEKERLSMLTVAAPAFEVMVAPLDELVGEKTPAKYRAYKWGEFYGARKFSNFRKLDTPVLEVADYKIRS
ncbi:protein DMR6-LIKE OXYGENASE 2 [Amborella trichopoda]|uniref:Fe2OG dioxygenase domain-containing protein n=1 Tax=Amborella trichopoda TaxID=13333 RepID=U5DDA6_AMBTC|nr:protein DMR6-LIKE OXYGENASE 2 [Amborella trichopoda]ERN18398.1 hypothetical protein AMTR_s00193p00016790 [Amborella trichopoda]|eukprot:XP_020530790.1 protein DMR6-LIKE OXYGENASE 2 [Amborella trichopoda]